MMLRKNPADLAFNTLKAYFYDVELGSFNWVFPIDTSEFIDPEWKRRSWIARGLIK